MKELIITGLIDHFELEAFRNKLSIFLHGFLGNIFFSNYFKPGTIPFRVRDCILFQSPTIDKGVGTVISPYLFGAEDEKVIIPKKIDLTYEHYKMLCKYFVRMNYEKCKLNVEKLDIEKHNDEELLFIIQTKTFKMNLKELSDFIDVVIADRAITKKKTDKIINNVLFLLYSIERTYYDYQSKKL